MRDPLGGGVPPEIKSGAGVRQAETQRTILEKDWRFCVNSSAQALDRIPDMPFAPVQEHFPASLNHSDRGFSGLEQEGFAERSGTTLEKPDTLPGLKSPVPKGWPAADARVVARLARCPRIAPRRAPGGSSRGGAIRIDSIWPESALNLVTKSLRQNGSIWSKKTLLQGAALTICMVGTAAP